MPYEEIKSHSTLPFLLLLFVSSCKVLNSWMDTCYVERQTMWVSAQSSNNKKPLAD